MNLERRSAGEYLVSDGEKVVRLTKGLNRKWSVEPTAGLPPGGRNVASYTEAKTVAEGMIRRGGEAGAAPGTTQAKVSRRATAALKAADPDTLRLTLSERLRQLADDVLAS